MSLNTKLLELICFIFLLTNCFAFEDIKNFKVCSVYDGDTFKINISDYPEIIGKEIPIRIRGVNCPEIRSKKEWSELKRVENKLNAWSAKNFLISVLKQSQCIELKNISRGKYFRIVADVYVDGVLLSDLIIFTGHGVEY